MGKRSKQAGDPRKPRAKGATINTSSRPVQPSPDVVARAIADTVPGPRLSLRIEIASALVDVPFETIELDYDRDLAPLPPDQREQTIRDHCWLVSKLLEAQRHQHAPKIIRAIKANQGAAVGNRSKQKTADSRHRRIMAWLCSEKVRGLSANLQAWALFEDTQFRKKLKPRPKWGTVAAARKAIQRARDYFKESGDTR
jgi:hypothetical protein